MNRLRKLAGFPRHLPFYLIPNPSEPRKKLSRVFPELQFTCNIAESLVFYNLDLIEVTDILIYNHGYTEENFQSTLCYFPCKPTMAAQHNLVFRDHKLFHVETFKHQRIRHQQDYLFIVEHFKNAINWWVFLVSSKIFIPLHCNKKNSNYVLPKGWGSLRGFSGH